MSFGETVRQQRAALGMRPEVLAERASVAPKRLDELEDGEPPTTAEVSAVARALAVDPAALWLGKVSSARTTARFRAPDGVTSLQGADALLLARAAEVGRLGGFLWSELERPPSPVVVARRVLAIDAYPEPWEQGYLLGAKARKLLHPAKQAIVSVEKLLVELGVHVATVEFATEGVLAASVFEPRALPVILVNSRARRAAAALPRRAVLAHELCHLLHDGGESDLLTLISRGSDINASEQRANGFAPSFIVPGGWLTPSSTDPWAMAQEVGRQWGLSFGGAAWHLKNSGRIESAVADSIQREPDKVDSAGFEPRLPSDTQSDTHPLARGLISELAGAAAASEVISQARRAEILRGDF